MKAQAGTSTFQTEASATGGQGKDSVPSAPASLPIETGTQSAERRAVARFSPLRDFLGVYVDPQTWGAAFYVLISLVTGSVYFIWTVTWLALSISFLILIIGLLFAALFLLSVRGVAALEVRLVRASLGHHISLPPYPGHAGSKWFERLIALVTNTGTWSAVLYMILQLPLAAIYFSVAVSLVTLALALMTEPFLYVLIPTSIAVIAGEQFHMPGWELVLIEIAGFLMLTAAMHMIRAIGRWHARYAQALLGG